MTTLTVNLTNKYNGPINVMVAWDNNASPTPGESSITDAQYRIVHGKQTKALAFTISDASTDAAARWSVVVRAGDDPNGNTLLYSKSYALSDNTVSIKVPHWSAGDIALYILMIFIIVVITLLLIGLLWSTMKSWFGTPSDMGDVGMSGMGEGMSGDRFARDL